MALWLGLWLAASALVQQGLDEGTAAFQAGDHAAALVEWSLALKEAREIGDTQAQAVALLGLSAANRALGRLQQAMDLAQLAEARGADAGRVLLARGLVLLDQGRLRQAAECFAAAFEHAQSTQQPAVAADAANNLGLARLGLGDHPGAEKALSAATRLMSVLKDLRGMADVQNNRGLARRRAGRLPEARKDLEGAVAGFRAAADWGGEADASSNLALVLQELGQDEAAEVLYRAALTTARQRRDLIRQGVLLQALGTLAHQRQQLEPAERHYAAAEDAFETAGALRRALGPALNRASLRADPAGYTKLLLRARELGDKRSEALAALNRGALALDTQDIERALALAEELELSEARWRAHYLLGLIEVKSGHLGAGIAQLRIAVDQLERTRRGLEPGSSQVFVVRYDAVYRQLIDALLAEGDTLGAFVYAERLQLASLGAPIPPPDEAGLRYQAMVEEEAWLSRSLTRELETGSSERSAALREQLASLRMEFAKTVDTLRASYPDFDQLVRVDPEDLEAVQADLDPGVAVLQPVLFDDKLVVLLVRRDVLKAVEVEADPAQVRRTLSRLTRSLRSNLIDDPQWTADMASSLGDWLIAPIQADLVGTHTLVVSATGPFRKLPFAMLRLEDRWLVEDMAVVNVTHVGSLRRRGAATPSFALSGPDLLLVGNPDGSLAGAEAEVQAIALQYPGATLVTGALAGREQFLELSRGKRALHLATHGVIDLKRPTRSYLVIGDSRRDSGRLAYGEIPGLAPWLADTRLVVLSACDSGLPVQASSSSDGELAISIHGLSAQFRRAGVETLVASLWKVEDGGTRSLMEAFYAQLAGGQDIAQALRAAQLEAIRTQQRRHPWFWASFVVAGDWR